jgi:tartrate dehydratase beta subunit/fumarate hydratase class I family protein
MLERRIDPVLVEKAIDVFRDIFYEEIPQDAIRPLDVAMQAALRVVFDDGVST